MNVCLLRYFNPVGAHPSGTPHRPPTLDYQAEPCEGEGEAEGEGEGWVRGAALLGW